MGSTCGISDEDADAIGSALADEATPGVVDAVNEIKDAIETAVKIGEEILRDSLLDS